MTFLRVQEVGLSRRSDPDVLEWAALNGVVVVTRDITTMNAFAYERVRQGLSMPGLVQLRVDQRNLGRLVEDLAVVALVSGPDELADRVVYLPL